MAGLHSSFVTAVPLQNMISRALQLYFFEQPEKKAFCNSLPEQMF